MPQPSATSLILSSNLHEVGASHGYILTSHLNKCTLLDNVMYSNFYMSIINSHSHNIRATSHTRPSAHDHYTLSTLIGGKGGASPSLRHTTLEGPKEYVNARWM